MTDEQYVRSRWVGPAPFEVLETKDPMPEFCSASVRIIGYGPCFYHDTLDAAWSAAAAYTRQREAELAQLDAEIERSSALVWDEEDWVDWMEYHTKGDAGYEPGEVTTVVRQQCADIRTLARLRSIRAEMARGWKESK